MKRKIYTGFQILPISKQRINRILIAPFLVIAFLFNSNTSSAQTGEALHFDGTDDLVTLPFLVNGSYTKEAWIYPTTLGGFHNIASGENTALYINLFNLAAGNSFPFLDVSDPTPLSANTWYHVAVTYNSATKLLSLYKNGTLVDDSVLTTTYTETINYLGAVQYVGFPTAFYGGQMDEVRFWNYDRSAAQISGNMSCNLTGDEPGLLAYYKFNQNTANGTNTGLTALADSTDKCVPSTATLSNFALTGTTSNWVSQGGAGNGVTGTCANNFENIALTGNSVCITSGDVTPSSADHTDFGTFAGSVITRTFTIDNTGNTTLNISLPVTRTAGVTSFNVISQPSATVAAGGSTSFQISYSPEVTGTVTATVSVNNSDGDEGNFTFDISANSVILPVEMTFFKGEKSGDMAKLVWQTASEHNNRGFEIQRSADAGVNWENIGFVAAGNSASVNTYNFTDRLPVKGSNAYRLKQVDIDGRFKISNTIVLNFTGAAGVISFYPNPVKNKLNLQFNDNSLLNTNVQISSVTGKVISKIKLTNNRQQIDLGNLAQGIYLLSFDNGEVRRIVKQ